MTLSKCITTLALSAALAGCVHTGDTWRTASDEPLHVARDVVGDGVFSAGIEGPAWGPDGALYAVSFGRDGTKIIPIAELRDHIGRDLAADIGALLTTETALKADPVAAAYFYRADGTPHPVGHLLKNPELAAVLRGTQDPLDLLGVAIDERALEHVLERQGSQFRITDLPKCYRLGHSSVQHDLAALFDELAGCDQGRDAVLGHDSIRRGIRDAVMLHVLELIAPDQAPPLNPTARKRMVDRAREYALSHLDEDELKRRGGLPASVELMQLPVSPEGVAVRVGRWLLHQRAS